MIIKVQSMMKDKSHQKILILYLDSNNLTIQSVAPTTNDELDELRELDKHGLVKFVVIDDSVNCISDKRIIHKLIDDLSAGNCCNSEIIDRSQANHSLLQIHAANIILRKLWLSDDEYKQRLSEEDKILEKYK